MHRSFLNRPESAIPICQPVRSGSQSTGIRPLPAGRSSPPKRPVLRIGVLMGIFFQDCLEHNSTVGMFRVNLIFSVGIRSSLIRQVRPNFNRVGRRMNSMYIEKSCETKVRHILEWLAALTGPESAYQARWLDGVAPDFAVSDIAMGHHCPADLYRNEREPLPAN